MFPFIRRKIVYVSGLMVGVPGRVGLRGLRYNYITSYKYTVIIS